MTRLSECQAEALATLTELGTTCTLQSVAATYDFDNAGTVTEVVVEYTATCSDLIDEAARYGTLVTDRRVAGTFYLAASGLDVTPTLGDRVVYLSRNFAVLAVWAYRLNAGVVAWRLDVAEIGSA